MRRIATTILLFLWQWTFYCSGENEPICTSRFDYDHKMLQKMLMLEMEQTKVKDLIEEQRNKIVAQDSIIRNLERTIEDEKFKRNELQRNITKFGESKTLEGTGATYIRWGRTTCPGNMTELVYKGYAGGSQHNNQGAASSYLCLPENPLWSVYEDAEQIGGTVWGAEYELGLHGRNMKNFFGKSIAQRDVPCSVCHTRRSAIMMVPARNKCYEGWTLEYQGYLTGGYDGHHATDFVCLDGEPEVLDGGEADNNGKLFYFMEARCGSLRCPPYVNGRELTCAVCSK